MNSAVRIAGSLKRFDKTISSFGFTLILLVVFPIQAVFSDSLENAHPESVSANLVVPANNGAVETKAPSREEPTIPEYLWNESYRLLEHAFRVRTVQIKGTYRLEQKQAEQLAGVGNEPWIWEVYTRDIAGELKRSPWVESAEVEWSFFPIALTIQVKESEPWVVAELRSENSGDSWVVSRSGKLLQSSSSLRSTDLVLETADLPRLDGVRLGDSEDLSIVTRRLDYTVRMLKMIDIGGGVPFQAERYSLLPGGGVLIVPLNVGEPQIALMPQTFEEARSQLQQLESVLADLRKRNETAKRIDLRFEGRAVVTL